MVVKYLVRKDAVVFGLRFQGDQKTLIIGGPKRYRDSMIEVLTEFGIAPVAANYEGAWTDSGWRTKARFPLGLRAWVTGLNNLETAKGYKAERVSSFRRLMS